MKRPHVVSFGYAHGDAPSADYVEDVRDESYHPDDWGTRAGEIAKAAKGAKKIAIGDKHGRTRAFHIANKVAKKVGGTVTHRDKGKAVMPLLKGNTPGIKSHNISEMRHAGHSEASSIAAAMKKAGKAKKPGKMKKGAKPAVKKAEKKMAEGDFGRRPY